jgi:RNA polymerase sigma-70 factor (ECF subfamily)
MTPVTYSVADILSLPHDAGTGLDAERGDRETAEVRGLLDRAKAGDHAAFGQLIGLYERVVYRTALAALGRREDAEDAAQDAFLQAWRNLSGFRGDAAFRTWLLTIVWRKALDRRRTRLLWWKRASIPVDDRDPFADVAGDAPTPEGAAMARDTARRLRTEIARLSPTLRDTLLLAASGEYTYEEISSILGTPLGTIKWRVSEARRIVAARIES